MIHLCINSPLHHIYKLCIMYQWQLIDPSSSMHHTNDPSLSIGFHLDIYHSHQGNHINQLLDINQWHQSNQTIYINDIWSNNLPNNQTIVINDNMIQHKPIFKYNRIPSQSNSPENQIRKCPDMFQIHVSVPTRKKKLAIVSLYHKYDRPKWPSSSHQICCELV